MDTQINANGRFSELLASSGSLNHEATVQGVSNLIDKLAPLLQSGRLHNVVDVLSALSDVVDLADDALIQKLTRNFEVFTAAAFNMNNALEYAVAQAGAQGELPSIWQTIRRINRDDDARRGLAVVVSLLVLLGRQARQGAMPMPDD